MSRRNDKVAAVKEAATVQRNQATNQSREATPKGGQPEQQKAAKGTTNPKPVSRGGSEAKAPASSKGGPAPKKDKTSRKGTSGPAKRREKLTAPAASCARTLAPTAGVVFAEIVPLDLATQIARIDGDSRSTDVGRYANSNTWQYYFGINTWYHVVYDSMHLVDPQGNAARHLIDHIRRFGLVATIGKCCDAAQSFVSTGRLPVELEFLRGDGEAVQLLQRLRFLKRFTVLEPDKLYADAQKDWLREEDRIKGFNLRATLPNTKYTIIVGYIKAILAAWLKGYKPVKIDSERPIIPTGATFDKRDDGGSLNLAERVHVYVRRAHDGRRFLFSSAGQTWEVLRDWREIDEQRVEKRTALFSANRVVPAPLDSTPLPHYPSKAARVSRVNRYTAAGPERTFLTVRRYRVKSLVRYNYLVFVPKNYKTPRSVCPEECLNQMMQRKIRDHIVACLPTWVRAHLPYDDQTVMEAVAACANALNLSTTDLSHASDSFSIRVFVDCYPASVREDVMRWRPTHTILPDGSVHTLQQLSTMGTGDVWILMGLFLLAAMVATCRLCEVDEGRENGCFAFGDDMIHPSEITDTLYEMLAVLGFVVNVDKSFGGDHPYRESCGSEWLTVEQGVVSVRTLYFPRFPIAAGNGSLERAKWNYDVQSGSYQLVDGLTRLIELQHKLYWDYPHAAEFISRAVKRIKPDMTTSIAGSVCSDLWGPFSEGPTKAISTIVGETVSEPLTLSFGTGRKVTFKPSDDKQFAIPSYRDDETGLTLPVNTRTAHMTPVIVYTSKKVETPELAEWRYLEFLQNGPTVPSDPVLALLHCTEAPTYADFTTAEIKWKLRR